MNRGDLLVAHTTIELPSGVEVWASWYFKPGSPPIYSGPVEACDPGSGPELAWVEVDGMMVPGESDCSYRLQQALGVKAFYEAEERAAEIAERDGPDSDDLYDRMRDAKLEAAWEGER